MTDKLAVLGQATQVTIGTHTVYTVGTGKSARVKFFFRGQAASGGATVVAITVNNIEVARLSITANNYVFSTATATIVQNATAPTGAAAATTVAPGAYEYFLDAGDIVSYTIATTDAQSMNFQVVGAEITVS